MLLERVDKPEVTVAVDGSLYRYHPKFHDRITEKISQLAPNRKVRSHSQIIYRLSKLFVEQKNSVTVPFNSVNASVPQTLEFSYPCNMLFSIPHISRNVWSSSFHNCTLTFSCHVNLYLIDKSAQMLRGKDTYGA